MNWLVPIAAQLALNTLFASVISHVFFETYDAVRRAHKKPNTDTIERRNFVIKYQIVTVLLACLILYFVIDAQPKGESDIPSLLIGVVYLWWIRSVANIDNRIKRLRKQQKKARQRALQTPDLEEGAV